MRGLLILGLLIRRGLLILRLLVRRGLLLDRPILRGLLLLGLVLRGLGLARPSEEPREEIKLQQDKNQQDNDHDQQTYDQPGGSTAAVGPPPTFLFHFFILEDRAGAELGKLCPPARTQRC